MKSGGCQHRKVTMLDCSRRFGLNLLIDSQSVCHILKNESIKIDESLNEMLNFNAGMLVVSNF